MMAAHVPLLRASLSPSCCVNLAAELQKPYSEWTARGVLFRDQDLSEGDSLSRRHGSNVPLEHPSAWRRLPKCRVLE